MRLILGIYERVPLLCKNLVTEPEETSIAYEAYLNMTICATYIPKVWLVPGCIVEAEISCAGRDFGPLEPLVGRRPLHRASWLSAFSPEITIELAISDGLLAWLLNWLQLIFER